VDAKTSIVSSAALAALQDEFLGEIALPDNPEYDAARVVWNGMIDRRPGIVARCSEVVDAHTGWGRSAMDAMKPFTAHGHYVNDMVESGDDVVRGIYGAEKYERLVELKRAYDPDNVFRLNQNIRPR
jgi:phage terminase large subunit-like protein